MGFIGKDRLEELWEVIKDRFQPKGNYLTNETDPTVPAWAKAQTKPTYTAAETGADPAGSANTALANAKTYTDDVIRESDFATKQYVAQQVGQNVFKKQIVTSLPTTDIDQNTIYMILKADAAGNDNYNEYINLTGTSAGWEFLGNTNASLTDYYNKAETNNLFMLKANIDSALSTTRTNPVQNKVVKGALDDLSNGKYAKPSTGIPMSDLSALAANRTIKTNASGILATDDQMYTNYYLSR